MHSFNNSLISDFDSNISIGDKVEMAGTESGGNFCGDYYVRSSFPGFYTHHAN